MGADELGRDADGADGTVVPGVTGAGVVNGNGATDKYGLVDCSVVGATNDGVGPSGKYGLPGCSAIGAVGMVTVPGIGASGSVGRLACSAFAAAASAANNIQPADFMA